MNSERGFVHAAALARLLFVLGISLCVLGLLFDANVVARFHFRTPLSPEALEQTRLTRTLYCACGVLLIAGGELVRRGVGSALLLRRRGTAGCLLAITSSLLPLAVLDRAARPFVERLTSLFVPDPELGWKHRPGAEDTYWGARVKINSYGMRGPERGPAKPAGVRRVLVLGDSVVFGLGLEDDAETLPARLERELEETADFPVECLDAAVCGWSPWQHQRFLAREGERWQPDLVLLGFVLNDVTERFGLAGFGGGGQGAQLASSRTDARPVWLAESGLYLALRELRGRLAFREDPAAALAHANRLTPYHLILEPDSERVQGAWRLVLPEIDSILAWCRSRSLPLLLVVFPYTIQLTNPEANTPQRILAGFARARELPCLDLLPELVAVQQRDALAPTDLFFDGLHPTPLGNRTNAAEIARFVAEHSLLR
jgi:lysophospholipase L1-like esterase